MRLVLAHYTTTLGTAHAEIAEMHLALRGASIERTRMMAHIDKLEAERTATREIVNAARRLTAFNPDESVDEWRFVDAWDCVKSCLADYDRAASVPPVLYQHNCDAQACASLVHVCDAAYCTDQGIRYQVSDDPTDDRGGFLCYRHGVLFGLKPTTSGVNTWGWPPAWEGVVTVTPKEREDQP